MHIIKLDATDSTNTYLKNLLVDSDPFDYTTVVAEEQSKGKGQIGALWESENGKNLTFSILKKFDHFSVSNYFLLNICVSLAVSRVLKEFSIPNLTVKWPNDILSGKTKICGILIENILQGDQIKAAIIGVGLNVNQTTFHTVVNATSMKMLLHQTFDLNELLKAIVHELEELFILIENKAYDIMRASYEAQLFRKDSPSTFKNTRGSLFMGIIRGVSSEGLLQVQLEDDLIQEFDLKEITLLY